MGIPSYFSYIIKNYSNIIRQFTDCEKFHFLFMDCNSIIYDVYYALEEQYYTSPFDITDIETMIIQRTIDKIKQYIQYISPLKYTYITFDGVVPLAKMKQQRIRRYKSDYAICMTETDKPRLWNTTKITPGTEFMEQLSIEIMKLKSDKIYVSTSNEYGEGEQKIFTNIREDDKSNDIAAVYGLDADLIMLSLFHVEKLKKIYIFREAPKFRSVVSKKINNNDHLFLDINELATSISNEMGNTDISLQTAFVHDYVLLCFLFGNDFLPHIVSLKLHANGMNLAMNAYKKAMKDKTQRLLKNDVVEWENMEEIIKLLAEGESERMKDILKRGYIKIEEGWQQRYKKQFRQNGSEVAEWKEGIEWIVRYYRGLDYNKGWKYKNEYGPLLSEMCKISKEKVEKKEMKEWINAKVQLAYVLPLRSHKLLGEEIAKYLKENHKELYPNRIKYEWEYSRYEWEAHPIIPEISLEQILEWNKDKIHFNNTEQKEY